MGQAIDELMGQAWQFGMVHTWAALRTARGFAEDEAWALGARGAGPVRVDFVIGPIREQTLSEEG